MHVNDLERLAALLHQALQEPPAEEPDTVTLPPELRGSLSGDVTPDQVNQILGRIDELMPQLLVCVWDRVDPYGFGGHKRLRFVTSCDLLFLAPELVAWLTLDPADPNCPETPGGYPDDWVGEEDCWSALAFHDDEHNGALEDVRSLEATLETEDRLVELGMPEIDRTICEYCGAWMTAFHSHGEFDEDNAAVRLPWRNDDCGPGGPFALAYAPNPQTTPEDRHIGVRRFPTSEAARTEADAVNHATSSTYTEFVTVIDTRDHTHRPPQK
ncbi:hypothetical protein ACL02S_23470 [Nocardia sp. 004]|uniref:hypothetical protein n=1 Tax=Nocardia sp. 004 TaxID=3385978 RepID=UPI0039A3A6C9